MTDSRNAERTIAGPEETELCNENYSEGCTKPATEDGWCVDHRRYFSNGTGWDFWYSANCERCVHDHFASKCDQPERGCPLIVKSLHHERIPEWIYMDNPENPDWPKLVCINFRGYGEGGREPKPKPVPPGQGQMFDPPSGGVLSPLEVEPKKERVRV